MRWCSKAFYTRRRRPSLSNTCYLTIHHHRRHRHHHRPLYALREGCEIKKFTKPQERAYRVRRRVALRGSSIHHHARTLPQLRGTQRRKVANARVCACVCARSCVRACVSVLFWLIANLWLRVLCTCECGGTGIKLGIFLTVGAR